MSIDTKLRLERAGAQLVLPGVDLPRPTRAGDDCCGRCGTDVFGPGGDYFVLHDEIWLQANNGIKAGLLCIACVEARLGCRLTPSDFPPVPVNDPNDIWFGGDNMSPAVLARLRGEADKAAAT